MLATERRYMAPSRSFQGISQAVKGDVNELSKSGQFYVTPEICRELKHIDNGIDHIRLDNDFLQSSKEWGNKFDPSRLAMDTQGAGSAMQKAAGSMFDIKNQMNSTRVNTLMDNQVRENHHWTVQNLKGVEREMAPYAHQSVDRIKQFCDHIGVTDRYTGYRHNLNRGNRDPQRLGYSWLDTNKNTYNNTLNVGFKPSRPASDSRIRTQSAEQRCFAPQPPQSAPPARTQRHEEGSIQERCGINTVFPGKSESTQRYVRPFRGQSTGQDYIVNPMPAVNIQGRPLAASSYEKSFTEYQNRYLWPDASRCMKLPWLRK